MFASHALTVSLILSSLTNAAPLHKRIAQVIDQSTHDWELACRAAGGGLDCNPQSVNAFTTLLVAAGPCDQQDQADSMIDLAKRLGSDPEMVRLTQLFIQQPRNSPNSLSIPYCQKSPRNSELNGLFQCQFAGVNPTAFVGGLSVGAAGTIPFGLTDAISPPGSCKASPNASIPDGKQLQQLFSDPGVGNAVQTKPLPAAAAATPPPAPEAASGNHPTANVVAGPSNAQPFALQNGLDAQALNRKFAGLSADSSCDEGEDACINGGFAQCVGGKFVVTGCAAGTTCAAVPLVNKAGTSLVCDTQDDVLFRIANAGATGGLTGDSSSLASASSGSDGSEPDKVAISQSGPAVSSPVTAETSSTTPFSRQNGLDAQALNQKFAGLTADSSCQVGDDACINGGFAQCVSGKFVVTGCAAGTTCAAVPLVNKAGTSIVCTTAADALSRIATTGATGGLVGN